MWDAAPDWRRTPQALRAALTESKVDADADPRVRWVGLEAYLAAGGGIERDLFQEDHADRTFAAQERLFQDDDSAWPAWQRIPL